MKKALIVGAIALWLLSGPLMGNALAQIPHVSVEPPPKPDTGDTAFMLLSAALVLIMAVCCFFAISFKVKLRVDDALDTFPVHGVGGTIGALLTGLFATKTVNSLGGDGLFFGNPRQLVTQLVAVLITYIVAAVGTFIIIKLLDATVGLRPNPAQELQGMDINEHGEEGYGEEFASTPPH